jgi:starvation-inducible outer membrane lipoprotein
MKTAILAVLILAGCASVPTGIEMSEDEAKACKEQGCTVWTLQELHGLARRIFGEGYKAGVKSL